MSALTIRTRPAFGRLTCANAATTHGRLFSASTSNSVSLQIEKNNPEHVANVVPAYPYGPARWYKQSNRGLYGGQKIQFGNNVGHKIEVKTRRSWHPNVRTKNLYSRALQRPVQVRVTTRTLRTIDKLGGLDEYLLGEKEARIRDLGESGWWLRWAIMQTPTVKKRYAAERERIGLPEMQQAEAELESTIASSAEVQEALASGEEVAVDGAFEVDNSPALPPLKFRVGPGAHMILTPHGWRRTKPSVEWMKESIFRGMDERQGLRKLTAAAAKIDKHLAAQVQAGEIHLHKSQQEPIQKRKNITMADRVHQIKRSKLANARFSIRTQLRAQASKKVEQILARRALRKQERAQARRQQAAIVEEVVPDDGPQIQI